MKRHPLHPLAKRLIWTRALRSIGQGMMVVDLALYLRAQHWSALSIGGVLSAAGLFGAVLILLAGMLSDRFGRKALPFPVICWMQEGLHCRSI